MYSVRDLKAGEFLIIRKIEVDDTGSGLYFFGDIPNRYASYYARYSFKNKKLLDFEKFLSEVKTQEQLECMLDKVVHPCFVDGECVGYKIEGER